MVSAQLLWSKIFDERTGPGSFRLLGNGETNITTRAEYNDDASNNVVFIL